VPCSANLFFSYHLIAGYFPNRSGRGYFLKMVSGRAKASGKFPVTAGAKPARCLPFSQTVF
jgi:hypothetical protein